MTTLANNPTSSPQHRPEDEIESVTTSATVSSTGFIVVEENDDQEEVENAAEEILFGNISSSKNPSHGVSFAESITTIGMDKKATVQDSGNDLTKSSTTTLSQEKARTAAYSTYQEDEQQASDATSTTGAAGPQQDSSVNVGVAATGGTSTCSKPKVASFSFGRNTSVGNASSLGAAPPFSGFGYSSSAAGNNGGASTSSAANGAGATPKATDVNGGKKQQSSATAGFKAASGNGTRAGAQNPTDVQDDGRSEVYLKLHFSSKGGRPSSNSSATHVVPAVSSTNPFGTTGLPSSFGIVGGGPLGSSGSYSSSTGGGFKAYPEIPRYSYTRSSEPGFVRYGDANDMCLPHCIINDGLGEICLDCGKTSFNQASTSASSTNNTAKKSTTTGVTTSNKKTQTGTPSTAPLRMNKKNVQQQSSAYKRAYNEDGYDRVCLSVSHFMEKWILPPMLIVFFFILADYVLGLISKATSEQL